ncbi:MAG: lactate utilization protein [Eubacterium sp.]|nr:lactate utilization protein [Eubacterium sp.]
MLPKKQYYANCAATIIKNLEKRNMKGVYFDTGREAAEYALGLVRAGDKVSYGGTMSMEELGMKEALAARDDITLYARTPDMTYIEADEKVYSKAFSCDWYFMSTNGITMDGELFNIDGWGNRTAALIYGPKNVVIVCGMNKVAPNLQACIDRVRNTASPANCVRLEKNTPCSKTGRCSECLSPDTICSQFVYTRHSAIPGRIQVVLAGEELGY